MDTTPRPGDTGGPAGHFLAEARKAVHLAQAHSADSVARTDAGNPRAGLEAAKLARKAAIRARDTADEARKFAILARDTGDKTPDPEEAEQVNAAGLEAGEAARAAREYADRAAGLEEQAALVAGKSAWAAHGHAQHKEEATLFAVEAAARAYYGAQDLNAPSSDELAARFRASWDAGRVHPDVMGKCRKAVRPLVLDALTAYRNADQ